MKSRDNSLSNRLQQISSLWLKLRIIVHIGTDSLKKVHTNIRIEPASNLKTVFDNESQKASKPGYITLSFWDAKEQQSGRCAGPLLILNT